MQTRQRLTISSPLSKRTAGKTMSSGTRKGWAPARFPTDDVATQRLREWLDADEGGLDAVGLDLSGADFTRADFSESWFTDARLRNVTLIGAELYRSDAQGADLTGADLTEASLVRVNLDDAVLRHAKLDGANLVKASLYDVDAFGASCRGTQFMGASLLNVDFRSADLSRSVFDENSFQVILDENTRMDGVSGSIFGPAVFMEESGSRNLSGPELQEWIRCHGGAVQVISTAQRG
ncbi:pentapeptide repeat-containing protein [Streptomyces sp. NPDC052023]|uniref:pentapeptide repeat-containing protein n=1 Tax=Streptomyces sp. NPDC052023 TaxID=3365681 RepID=UPI0037CE9EE8